MKNYTKCAFLTLLVATSGLSARPTLTDRWNNWSFDKSRVGRWLNKEAVASEVAEEVPAALEAAAEKVVPAVEIVEPVVEQPVSAVSTTWKDSAKAWFDSAKTTCLTEEGRAQAWQSTKQWGSERYSNAANSRLGQWLAKQKNAVTGSFDSRHGHKVEQVFKDYPYAVAGAAGAFAYSCLKPIARAFGKAKIKTQLATALLASGLTAYGIKTSGITLASLSAVNPYVAAAAVAGFTGIAGLDCYLKKNNSERTIESSSRSTNWQ